MVKKKHYKLKGVEFTGKPEQWLVTICTEKYMLGIEEGMNYTFVTTEQPLTLKHKKTKHFYK